MGWGRDKERVHKLGKRKWVLSWSGGEGGCGHGLGKREGVSMGWGRDREVWPWAGEVGVGMLHGLGKRDRVCAHNALNVRRLSFRSGREADRLRSQSTPSRYVPVWSGQCLSPLYMHASCDPLQFHYPESYDKVVQWTQSNWHLPLSNGDWLCARKV